MGRSILQNPMPRINRIRIVNFSYNNDTRHILDETFDLHGGANALLNLANGGGKSVLVQLFLQPVVPGARIQGRNLAAFFRKQKLPTYIMTEWKLDGAGGYLLTGIGIVPVEAQGVEGEEKSRIKYFAFTLKYTDANSFDLAHIALVTRKGNVLEVMPFREARELMAAQERKDPYLFGYFAEEDTGRYAQRLAEFGISQEEWRNIIARINDSEGGLEEIFQKCKTSGQLLNDWVIKTVEKAMFRDRAEARRLEELLENLVKEVVENERFIVEKQLLDSFSGEFKEQVDLLAGLLAGIDRQQQLGGKLTAMHSYLQAETRTQQEKLDNNRLEMEACHTEEQRVHLEERSQDYYWRQTKLDTALEALSSAEQARTETQGSLDHAQLRDLILRAARIAGDIRRKKVDQAGVEEQLAAARRQFDADTQIKNLEYSLKIRYEEYLQTIAGALEQLQEVKTAKESLFAQTREDVQALDGESNGLATDSGRLEERKQQFEANEKTVMRQLGLALRRNLLGGLDQAEIQKTGTILDNNRKNLEKEINRLQEIKAATGVRLGNIAIEVQGLHAARQEQRLALQAIDRDIADYDQQEADISKILDRYGFAFDTRFDGERLSLAFKQLAQNLENRKGTAAQTRDQAAEALQAIKKGCLHGPAGFGSMLANMDIPYETGETYLRSQQPAIRRQLLKSNPVLPYAFILSSADIDRVAAASARQTMRHVIPLIAHEDLGRTVASAGRVARSHESFALCCLYEGRMFDNDSLDQLVAELEHQRSEAAEQYDHLAGVANAAIADSAVCARFNYTAGYLNGLEQKRDADLQSLQQLDNQTAALNKEKVSLMQKQEEVEANLRQRQRAHEQAGEAVAVFMELLNRERDYQDCLAGLAGVNKKIAGAALRKKVLTARLESLQEELYGLKAELRRKEDKQGAARDQYSLYKNAPVAEMVAGSAEELEERLKAIKADYSGEIGPLEARKKGIESDLNASKKELAKLGLEEKQYAGDVYDELAETRNREEIKQLTALLNQRQQSVVTAAKHEGAARQALADALKEVIRLGTEAPLPPETITGDFAARRARARQRVNELDSLNTKISGQISSYRKITEKIEVLVDTAVIAPDQGFVPERNLQAQLEMLEKDFRQLERDIREIKDKLKRSYDRHREHYRDQNLNIDNIFKGLDPLWNKPDMGYNDYYFLYERTSQHLEKLAELIKLYEIQLANLEQDKKDMVQQSWLHGLRIYEEVQWISDNSKVRLQGRNRPVQMLKIDLQLDSNHAGMLRIQEYIEGCIVKVREVTRQDKREDEVRKLVAKLMASRELLDVFLGTRHIPVSVFKVDLNAQNSRLKLWEDAVRENSGGEKFVVFFAVLAALMAYTRARTMEAAGADPDTDTRVLVMDNPFGPISSEHLLSPLFEIARKYRTQLICLSDLKQNSIMNCFNLIYMLKVRTSAIGGNEYLKFEEIVRDESAVLHDEKLEKAIFRASDFKQVSLFEEM